MAVNSLGYLIVFPIIIILYYALPKTLRVAFLALASVAMYALWGWSYTLVLVFVTVVTYLGALVVEKSKADSGNGKAALFANVVMVAAILGSIRFMPKGSVIVPIGISFYSLQALGYVADVYNSKVKAEKNFIKYFLFVSFFPVVTSGPIQRSDVFLRQINEDKEFDYDRVRSGLLMIAYGLFAKNFVADRLDYLVGHAYEGYETQTGLVLLMGVVLYAFQLYCDFMGYSYIALGSAKALGFDLPDNFRQPYFSKSVKEFWGRWHISLSEWLRDYIYFPLGGSRKGRARTLINIAIVFVVSGIWHGSGLTFLVWGTLHGLYRIVEELVRGTRDSKKAAVKDTLASKLFAGVAVIRTFILVDFAWLFFRAESVESAFVIIRRIFTESEMVRTIREGLYTFGLAKKEVLVWLLGLLVVIVIDILHEKGIHVGEWLKKRNIILRWAFYLIFVCFMLGTMIYYYGYSASTFIYSGF